MKDIVFFIILAWLVNAVSDAKNVMFDKPPEQDTKYYSGGNVKYYKRF